MCKEPVYEYRTKSSEITLTLPDGNKKKIDIRPGWAFGAGDHPSTSLCIKALEKLFKLKEIKTVFDIGCGTGILAISAAALGAHKVVGIDIESAIIGEAKANIKKNGYQDKIKVSCDSINDINEKFDLITANILKDAILVMSNSIVEKINEDGLILLSGIRNEQKDIILDRFQTLGLNIYGTDQEKEWVSIIFKNSMGSRLRN